MGEALGGLVKGSTEVGKELSEQGKKIISKKYGEDMVKTMAGEGEARPEDKPMELKEEAATEGEARTKKDLKEEDSNVRMKE